MLGRLNVDWSLFFQIVAGIASYIIIRSVSKILANRFDRLRPTNLLFAWLIEIASDIRKLGKNLALFSLFALPAATEWGWIIWWVRGCLLSYIVIIVAIAASTFINVWEHWSIAHLDPTMSDRDRTLFRTLTPVFANATKYVIAAIAGLALCSVWGIDIFPILSGLGLAGLVIGLGAQTVIGEMIAGVLLIVDRKFYVGSEIEIFYGEGHVLSGIVDRITLRLTFVKEENGAIVSVSNRIIDIVRVIQK